MQELLNRFKAGHLDDGELRKFHAWYKKANGNHYFQAYLFQNTGYGAELCGRCALATFSANAGIAYQGQQVFCKLCSEYYTDCLECNTKILKADANSGTHLHTIVLAPAKKKVLQAGMDANGNMVPIEVEAPEPPLEPDPNNKLHAYNADVMQKRMIHRTLHEETIIRKRQQVGIKDDPHRYFGIELEVEKVKGCPPDIIAKVVAALGNDFAIVKHDGSLSDQGKGGFEIVSAPATREYHESGVWDKFFDNLGVFFQESPDTTGLHFHVSKNNISQLTQGKMLLFVNSKDNLKFICDVADRDLTKPSPNGKFYAAIKESRKPSEIMTGKVHLADCPWHSRNRVVMNRYKMDAKGRIMFDPWGHPIIKSIEPEPSFIRPRCKCPEGRYSTDVFNRYEALNVATKRETIEFRIFKGQFNKEKFFADLEFCDALVDFCSQAGPKEMVYNYFCDWLTRGHRNQFRNLYKRLLGMEYIDDPKAEPKSNLAFPSDVIAATL